MRKSFSETKIPYIPRSKISSARYSNKENIPANKLAPVVNRKKNLAKNTQGLTDPQIKRQGIGKSLVAREVKRPETLKQNQPLQALPTFVKNELKEDEIMQKVKEIKGFNFASSLLPNELKAEVSEYWKLDELVCFLKAVYVPIALIGENELRNSRTVMAELAIEKFSGDIRLPQDKGKIDLILKNVPGAFFKGLVSLKIEEDVNWQEIVQMFPRTKSLELSSNILENLEGIHLESIQALENLTTLKLHCPKFESLNSLAGLAHLMHLDVSGCQLVRSLEGIQNLTQLKTLKLNACASLESLDGIEHLTQLMHLELDGGERLKNLNGIQSLKLLKTLNLKGCAGLQNLALLSNLNQLNYLDISQCENLESLEGIEGLINLTYFNIHACRNLCDVYGIGALRKLTHLDMGWCEKLRSLDGLETLTELKTLNLKKCSLLENLTILAGLTQLTDLDLSRASKLKNLEGIEHLKALTRLVIAQCPQLKNTKGIEQLPYLKLDPYEGIEGFENGRLMI